MGFVRAPAAVLIATLAGGGLGACATHPADAPDSTRLQWLASSLADELDLAGPDDPRVAAAADDLRRISGFATVAASNVAPAEWVFVAAVDAPALEGFADGLEPAAPLAPLSPAALAAAALPDMALALGRFTDPAMAGVMWREIQGLDSAALTGLAGYIVVDAHGAALVAGPVAGAENAEQRCMALSVWGLSCTPAAWPAGAQVLTGGGS